jgi:hypothetical protein
LCEALASERGFCGFVPEVSAEEMPVDFVVAGEGVPWEGVEPSEPVAGELVFAVGEGFGPWDGEGFADALGVGAVFGDEVRECGVEV